MEPSLVVKSFLIHGRVQGVGFRWWSREQALAIGCAGWVRNRPDGSVEIVMAGRVDQVEELTARLSEGPSLAEVTDVTPLPIDPTETFSGFDIVQ